MTFSLPGVQMMITFDELTWTPVKITPPS